MTFKDGKESQFEPLQMHLHAPSEHTIDGKYFDLEMHIVHKHKHSQQIGAVIAILFDQSLGGENRLLEQLYPFLLSEETE